jgi:hypothetical protein
MTLMERWITPMEAIQNLVLGVKTFYIRGRTGPNDGWLRVMALDGI